MFLPDSPLLISQVFLAVMGTQITVVNGEKIPTVGPLLLVSNHRSFMDPLLMMAAAHRSIRFACHPYMQQVPLLRDLIWQLGCLPLDAGRVGRQSFFRQAQGVLNAQQAVGIFPEGAASMIDPQPPGQVGTFQRGFAHLALRAAVPGLIILPVAIASLEATQQPSLPLRYFSLFDPSEPMFQGDGQHPLVMYQRVSLLVGRPWSAEKIERSVSAGSESRSLARDLADYCQREVQQLLQTGCY
jgi:1-acyl-sn-glycerol-3-phosphate acyltransferase